MLFPARISYLWFLQPLNEQISRLHEELAAERLSREVMDERKTKEIKAVESGISLDLTAEKRVGVTKLSSARGGFTRSYRTRMIHWPLNQSRICSLLRFIFHPVATSNILDACCSAPLH